MEDNVKQMEKEMSNGKKAGGSEIEKKNKKEQPNFNYYISLFYHIQICN